MPGMDLSSEACDFLIVGGGSAGCVLASRLSEDPATRVLLVEAGHDVTAADMPPVLASAYPGRTHYKADWLWPSIVASRGDSGRSAPMEPSFYEQARILGGGSSINGICANRGSPQDYDEWAAQGARGWNWSEVLPYFKKLETDADYGEPLHGTSGPVPIRRHGPADWTGFTRTMVQILAEMGNALHEDQNGAWQDGIFPNTFNVDEHGRRASAATAYLSPQVRCRPNLTIFSNTSLKKLDIENGRVQSAHFIQNHRHISLTARQVILSAGALQSPILLMRSGIGPAAHLIEHGIPVQSARSGVGENLHEHPLVAILGFLRPSARMRDVQAHHLQALLRYSSGVEGAGSGDMHVMVVSRGGWHAVGRRLGVLGCWVNKSFSTGSVRLSANPDKSSDIDFRMLSDPRDMTRLKAAFRLCVRAMTAAQREGVVLDIFQNGYAARNRELARPSRRNNVLTAVAGPMMDYSATFRRQLMNYGLGSRHSPVQLASDDSLLDAFLRTRVSGCWHACGTCRMGDPSDPMAVTDASGRVIGVEGLRVCDASLMPTIPCANLNLPVMMIAEKVAATIRGGG
jgi:5-(hydroxymethyl)furfural/furfural oxidase